MRITEIKTAFAAVPAAVADAAIEKHNCETAEVDEKGDIWIEGPQRGHWLDEEELAELAEWVETDVGQELATWAGIA